MRVMTFMTSLTFMTFMKEINLTVTSSPSYDPPRANAAPSGEALMRSSTLYFFTTPPYSFADARPSHGIQQSVPSGP